MKASSAYSAMVQPYACSGQLPPASGMKQKKKTEHSGYRYGCRVAEDMYHVFVKCGIFKALREEAIRMIVKKVEKQIEEFNLEESHVMGLQEAAELFFCDSDFIWLLHYSI
jgi:hypothetical protein